MKKIFLFFLLICMPQIANAQGLLNPQNCAGCTYYTLDIEADAQRANDFLDMHDNFSTGNDWTNRKAFFDQLHSVNGISFPPSNPADPGGLYSYRLTYGPNPDGWDWWGTYQLPPTASGSYVHPPRPDETANFLHALSTKRIQKAIQKIDNDPVNKKRVRFIHIFNDAWIVSHGTDNGQFNLVFDFNFPNNAEGHLGPRPSFAEIGHLASAMSFSVTSHWHFDHLDQGFIGATLISNKPTFSTYDVASLEYSFFCNWGLINNDPNCFDGSFFWPPTFMLSVNQFLQRMQIINTQQSVTISSTTNPPEKIYFFPGHQQMQTGVLVDNIATAYRLNLQDDQTTNVSPILVLHTGDLTGPLVDFQIWLESIRDESITAGHPIERVVVLHSNATNEINNVFSPNIIIKSFAHSYDPYHANGGMLVANNLSTSNPNYQNDQFFTFWSESFNLVYGQTNPIAYNDIDAMILSGSGGMGIVASGQASGYQSSSNVSSTPISSEETSIPAEIINILNQFTAPTLPDFEHPCHDHHMQELKRITTHVDAQPTVSIVKKSIDDPNKTTDGMKGMGKNLADKKSSFKKLKKDTAKSSVKKP